MLQPDTQPKTAASCCKVPLTIRGNFHDIYLAKGLPRRQETQDGMPLRSEKLLITCWLSVHPSA